MENRRFTFSILPLDVSFFFQSSNKKSFLLLNLWMIKGWHDCQKIALVVKRAFLKWVLIWSFIFLWVDTCKPLHSETIACQNMFSITNDSLFVSNEYQQHQLGVKLAALLTWHDKSSTSFQSRTNRSIRKVNWVTPSIE